MTAPIYIVHPGFPHPLPRFLAIGLAANNEDTGTCPLAEVEIYSSMLCGFCHRAKALLKAKGVAYREIDVTMSPGKRAEMVQRADGRRTVPQIFIDGRGIGGCDELYALEGMGKLDALLRAE